MIVARQGHWRPWLFILAMVAAGTPSRAASTASEVQVKAAFIFHFTEFVDWPPQSFASAHSPFIIGVLGGEQLDEALAKMVQGESRGGHPLEVRRLRRRTDVGGCQILYVANETEDLFRAPPLGDAPILTVGESDAFLRAGGMIAFLTDRNHVRLHINLTAAQAASLQISAKLLRVAQVITP